MFFNKGKKDDIEQINYNMVDSGTDFIIKTSWNVDNVRYIIWIHTKTRVNYLQVTYEGYDKVASDMIVLRTADDYPFLSSEEEVNEILNSL